MYLEGLANSKNRNTTSSHGLCIIRRVISFFLFFLLFEYFFSQFRQLYYFLEISRESVLPLSLFIQRLIRPTIQFYYSLSLNLKINRNRPIDSDLYLFSSLFLSSLCSNQCACGLVIKMNSLKIKLFAMRQFHDSPPPEHQKNVSIECKC